MMFAIKRRMDDQKFSGVARSNCDADYYNLQQLVSGWQLLLSHGPGVLLSHIRDVVEDNADAQSFSLLRRI